MIYHYNEVPIFYEVQGDGPIMVLLHGFLESSTMWESIVPELINTNTIIYMDLPGHGKSGVLNEVHTMEMMAAVVYSLLKSLGVHEATFVGHSMGGYVCLALVEKYPEMIEHLVLLNSTTYADSQERKIQRERALQFMGKEKDTIISLAITNLFSTEARSKYSKEIEGMKKEALQFPTQGITAAIRGMKDRKDRTQVLKSFSNNKTIVCGSTDPIVPLSISEKMARETGADFKILEGSHMSWLENRAEIVKMLHFIE
ncbi:MAG: alpha/beta hydrolase [Aureisphaera sp.]